MSVSGDHSVIINIPRTRTIANKSISSTKVHPIYTKMSFQKKYKKPSNTSLEKYILCDHKPLQVNALKFNDLTLSYKLFAKKQENLRHKQRLSISLIEKYKINYTDLRKRLHIEDPPNDVNAVTDIDDSYFRYLEKRPLAKHIPMYKSLKCLYSKGLRLRHEVGNLNDCILNIELNYRRELEEYNNTLNKYAEQVKYFDKFISEDYHKSMKCLKKWDDVKKQLKHKMSELENLANQKFTTVSRLIGLDYLYGLQQKYGRFLYYLSPPSWRSKHREFAMSVEIEAKGFDFGTSSEEDTFNVIFDKMQKECYSGLVKPPIYFDDPKQILDIFDGIEKQQLHHFRHVTYLAPHAKTLKKEINFLKEKIAQDSALVAHMVKRYQKLLEFSEERESQLQSKFSKIIQGAYFDSVGKIDVLELNLHLQFCYEHLFADEPSNMSMYAIAKTLESFYMDYCTKFDIIHNVRVKKATKQYIDCGKNKLRRAKWAARELRLFDRLERDLLSAFEPAATSYLTSCLPTNNKRSFI